ncbi:hypothetical protein FQN57_005434 [Myotisia sp. PD_48]|nr:hypothetical protein FQN57_005434 [Myotisia sp. PD_48]
MSRGGRGGRGRGRMLPGAEFSGRPEPGAELDTAPTPLFPKYAVPVPGKLSVVDISRVEHYRQLREAIHDGPYYTVLSGPPSWNKKGHSVRAQFDPFQGMATYSERYMKKTRALPELSAISFEMNFFPKELWSTLDPKYVGLPSTFSNGFGSLSQKRGLEDDDEEDDDDDTRRKRRNVGEDEEDEEETGVRRRGGPDEEDEEGEEEIVDDDFEDNEEEMGGDYNAEQYFDGGDELGDGYDDGGGEDGDIY